MILSSGREFLFEESISVSTGSGEGGRRASKKWVEKMVEEDDRSLGLSSAAGGGGISDRSVISSFRGVGARSRSGGVASPSLLKSIDISDASSLCTSNEPCQQTSCSFGITFHCTYRARAFEQHLDTAA